MRPCACVPVPSASVRSPCLHRCRSAEFIVSEYLLDKGLEGFERNVVFSVVQMMSSATKQRDVLEQPLRSPACFTQPYLPVYLPGYRDAERRLVFFMSCLGCLSEPLSVAALRSFRLVETAAFPRPQVSGMSCVRQLTSSARRSRDVPPSARTSSSAATEQTDALPFPGTRQK